MSESLSRRHFLGAAAALAATPLPAAAEPRGRGAIHPPLPRGALCRGQLRQRHPRRRPRRRAHDPGGGHPRRRGRGREDPGAGSGRQLGRIRRIAQRGGCGPARRVLHARTHEAGRRRGRAGGDQDAERGGAAGAQVHQSHPAGRVPAPRSSPSPTASRTRTCSPRSPASSGSSWRANRGKDDDWIDVTDPKRIAGGAPHRHHQPEHDQRQG